MPLRDDMISILNKLIREQGPTHGSRLLTDDRLLRNLLADYAPQFIPERNLILLAVREKMAETLFKAAKRGEQVDPILVGRLIRQLENDHGIAAENAQWAIRAWVEGLGGIIPPQFRSAPVPPLIPSTQSAPTRPSVITRLRQFFRLQATPPSLPAPATPIVPSKPSVPAPTSIPVTQVAPSKVSPPAPTPSLVVHVIPPRASASAPPHIPATQIARSRLFVPQHRLGDRWTEPKSGMKMVYVPPGEFMMGSNGYDNEKPVHKVHITHGFWLGLTPVTNAMYAKFVADGGYRIQSYWTPEGWQWRQRGSRVESQPHRGFISLDQPRVGVTWYEAVAFCNWAGLRLPTEAEWEYAARGPQNRVYPWGDVFDESYVIYVGNSGGKTHSVGEGIRTMGASWCGALDMSGNVWEWAADWFSVDSYPTNAVTDPSGPMSGSARVLRGGSWLNIDSLLRGAYRHWNTPNIEDNSYYGFRCARF